MNSKIFFIDLECRGDLFIGCHIIMYHLVEQIRLDRDVYDFRVRGTDQVPYAPWRNRAEIFLHSKIFSSAIWLDNGDQSEFVHFTENGQIWDGPVSRTVGQIKAGEACRVY